MYFGIQCAVLCNSDYVLDKGVYIFGKGYNVFVSGHILLVKVFNFVKATMSLSEVT